jgi:hypothetical protein
MVAAHNPVPPTAAYPPTAAHPRAAVHRRVPARRASALAAAVMVALAGCGSSASPLPGVARAEVRAAAGSYGGVRLGSPVASIAARLGPSLDTNDTTFLKPSAQPPFLPADNPYDVVYPDVRFTTVGGRVAGISVYGRGARSDRGGRLGESLARVRAELPGGRCVAPRGGLDPEAPGCQYHVGAGVYEYFSGDPVVLIALSPRPMLP